jgi:hypothetical protein
VYAGDLGAVAGESAVLGRGRSAGAVYEARGGGAGVASAGGDAGGVAGDVHDESGAGEFAAADVHGGAAAMIEMAWLPPPQESQWVRLPYCLRCWAPIRPSRWQKNQVHCPDCGNGKSGPKPALQCTRCRVAPILPKAERKWRAAMCEPCFRAYRRVQWEKRLARLE